MNTDKVLADTVAVVTGAGRGIGRSIAEAYGSAGAHIICAGRTKSHLDAVAETIASRGGAASVVVADVTDESAVQRVFTRADELGRLDLTLLNAGGLPARGPVESSSLADWQQSFDLNVTAAFLCARAAIPRLRSSGGGKLILVGSGIGHAGSVDFSAYSCAKAAQWMLTRVLADEVRSDPISVNEIVPGPVETTVGTGDFDPNRYPGEWAKHPDDVVPLAMMLATQPNWGPTGQSYSLVRRRL
jgi:3-oxoacyl-[acyl-carrier protein] reductase